MKKLYRNLKIVHHYYKGELWQTIYQRNKKNYALIL